MTPALTCGAILVIVAGALALAARFVEHGPRVLYGLAAVITAIAGLATALSVYAV